MDWRCGYEKKDASVLFNENTVENELMSGSKVYAIYNGNYDYIVLYLHGGGYTNEIHPKHVTFCDKLVNALGAKVVMPFYPLAPESTFEAAYALLDEVYDALLKEKKPIIIMGDSAGGGLALGYTQYRAEKGEKLPDKMVLLSPWLDVNLSNPDIAEVDKRDTMLTPYGAIIGGKAWAGDTPTTDYRISPIYGKLDNLPDTLMFLSADEIVYPVYDIPKQRKCIDEIVKFVK